MIIIIIITIIKIIIIIIIIIITTIILIIIIKPHKSKHFQCQPNIFFNSYRGVIIKTTTNQSKNKTIQSLKTYSPSINCVL